MYYLDVYNLFFFEFIVFFYVFRLIFFWFCFNKRFKILRVNSGVNWYRNEDIIDI